MSISSDLSESKDTIKDFREEMKGNIIASCSELLKEDYSEDEAFKLAVDKFGDSENLKEDLTSAFKTRGKTNKVSFLITISALILALAFFLFHNIFEKKITHSIPHALEYATSVSIQQGIALDNNKIENLMKEYKKQVKLVAIYKVEDGKVTLKNIYPARKDSSEINKLSERYLTSSIACQNSSSEQYFIKIIENRIDTHNIGHYLWVFFFLVYWVAFAIWASTYAYYINNLNFGWVLSFVIFNILAYAVFRLTNKLKLRNKLMLD
jgi:hypothetical protein